MSLAKNGGGTAPPPKKYILCDTRQKDGKHEQLHSAIQSFNYSLIKATLPFGDYAGQLPFKTVVDTKDGIYEFCQNFLGAKTEQARLQREIERAISNGAKLIFLVIWKESDGYYLESLHRLVDWTESDAHWDMRNPKIVSGGRKYSKARRYTGKRINSVFNELMKYEGAVDVYIKKSADAPRFMLNLLMDVDGTFTQKHPGIITQKIAHRKEKYYEQVQ